MPLHSHAHSLYCRVQGPNVIGGYPHPETGKVVGRDEHKKLIETHGTGWHAHH